MDEQGTVATSSRESADQLRETALAIEDFRLLGFELRLSEHPRRLQLAELSELRQLVILTGRSGHRRRSRRWRWSMLRWRWRCLRHLLLLRHLGLLRRQLVVLRLQISDLLALLLLRRRVLGARLTRVMRHTTDYCRRHQRPAHPSSHHHLRSPFATNGRHLHVTLTTK